MSIKYSKSKKDDSGIEKVLTGRAVSKGISIGKAFCLYGIRNQYSQITLNESEVENEIKRFRLSIEAAIKNLLEFSKKDTNQYQAQEAIFDTHKLFLTDGSFLKLIEDEIANKLVNAEWAVKSITDIYVNKYKSSSDRNISEKYLDLKDVAERILTSLSGDESSSLEVIFDSVVVAKEISPSTLVKITKFNPKALITENGGWTSHTFILARELEIPAITGLKNILSIVETGEDIIVDGFEGKVITNPTLKTVNKYKAIGKKTPEHKRSKAAKIYKPLKTLDGFEVTIRANFDSSIEYKSAANTGAKGIGLFRTEYLFDQHKGYPTEDQQFRVYNELAKVVGSNGLKIRTFDLNLEQVSNSIRDIEKNPALGLRGMRLARRFETKFREQIRAILRASINNNVDIILPMVSDISEILWSKKIISEEKVQLKNIGERFGNPKIGTMIEVPAAVLIIDKIFEESDFVSVGTNDLVQYLLSVDRDNETVADFYNTLHPAVLSSIKIILNASKKHKKQTIICGEMAGSPIYIPILIAYGANELSMNPNSIERVRNVVSNITQKKSKNIVRELEIKNTSEEIEKLLNDRLAENWSHLYNT